MKKNIGIIHKLLGSDLRTQKVNVNILLMSFLQAFNVLISFLLVPIVMDFVSPEQYGIWLTISSMVSWLSILDIGLGAGLKNKLTEALAQKNTLAAREYISTAYISLSCLILITLLSFVLIFPFINWSKVYNQSEDFAFVLKYTTLIVVSFFLIRLVLSLIGTVLISHLKPAANQAINTLSNLFIFITICLLSHFVKGNLIILSSVLSSSIVIVYLVVSIILYNGKYKEISPSFKYYNKMYLKSILGLGFYFFLINISTIILFQASNFIIIHAFNSTEVVVYNLAYKLFGIVSILFGLISQPYWTAYTEAWTVGDKLWIKKTISKVKRLWIGVIILGFLLFICSPIIYKIWIGNRVEIPLIVSFVILLYFISHTFGGVYNIFINATGKIKLQVMCLILVVLFYIPLVYLFIHVFKLGIISIPLAQLCSNFYSLFIARIQYKKLISGTATGIWNK